LTHFGVTSIGDSSANETNAEIMNTAERSDFIGVDFPGLTKIAA